MKLFVLVLFLLVSAIPLFARDEGGDGAYIPDYQQLVQEGYGPHPVIETQRDAYFLPGYVFATFPRPTQAYYGRGYTIFYGFTPVRIHLGDEDTIYAFGYPLSFFRSLMPESINNVDLYHYKTIVHTNDASETESQLSRREAVTSVQSDATTTTTTQDAAKKTAP